MKLTQFSEVDFYRARVEQLEREFMGHKLRIAETKDQPGLSDDDRDTILEDSETALAILADRHATALGLLETATASVKKSNASKSSKDV